jgi:hypothetical protein
MPYGSTKSTKAGACERVLLSYVARGSMIVMRADRKPFAVAA